MLEKRLFMAESCPWKGFKKGFTLAEVLITLSIIGVVAALTMPSVIANHKTSVRNQQFKKAYSTVANAINLMQAERGTFPNCYYRTHTYNASYFTECSNMFEEFASKMNVIKTCKTRAFEGGCIPEYTDIPMSVGCQEFTQANINNRSYAYVLADGTIIFTYGLLSHSLFAVDINGKKGPNLRGHDVFTFKLDDMGTKIVQLVPGGCETVEQGGVTSTAMFKNVIYK